MSIGLSTAISGGAGLLGSLFGGLFGNYQQKKANEYNRQQIDQQFQRQKELAQYQYDLNLQQWNRENEYNSPTSQLARLRAAGLNPHLIYGHGAVPNQSAQSPKYEAPQPGSSQMVQGDIMGNMLQGQQLFQQIEAFVQQMSNLKSQRGLNSALAARALADASLKTYDTQLKRKLEGYTVQAADMSNKNLQSIIDNREQQTRNLGVEYNLKLETVRKIQKETDLIAGKIVAQDWENKFAEDTYDNRVSIVKQTLNHMGAQIAKLMQDIAESESRISLQTEEYYSKRMDNQIKAETGLSKAKAELRKIRTDCYMSLRKAGYTGESGNVYLWAKDFKDTFLFGKHPSVRSQKIYDEVFGE